MKGQRKLLLLLPAFLLLLTGCGQKTLPDLSQMGKLQVISREDGSGTKAEFENLVDTDASGTKEIAASTEDMIQQVEAAKDAIGYVAYSALQESAQIKVLAIDGSLPTQQTIEERKYPLTREYYVAYPDTLSAVTSDFLYYVQTKGQELVGKYCVPVQKSETFLSDQSKGTIVIHGSSSMAPMMQELAADYEKQNPNAKIEIEVSDSTQGINDVLQNRCDLAMSSRSLKAYEKELLQTQVFGRDAIAVIVNTENPLEELSKKDIQKIYDKKYENWQDLNNR